LGGCRQRAKGSSSQLSSDSRRVDKKLFIMNTCKL
jgi:hypothetical protein